ncbi:MAG: mechanosensitive ion channel family protein, partial [Verrucomicrobia bacterium]|nr:mechanosensitive ion channel family protein [Prolixibacteraceae bacterium]
NNPNWDERVFNVQITDAKEFYKELRIMVSSIDASKNWDLKVEIREKVIDFIHTNYPYCVVKVPFINPQVPDKARDG